MSVGKLNSSSVSWYDMIEEEENLYNYCFEPAQEQSPNENQPTSVTNDTKSNLTDIAANIDSFHMVTPLKNPDITTTSNNIVAPVKFNSDNFETNDEKLNNEQEVKEEPKPEVPDEVLIKVKTEIKTKINSETIEPDEPCLVKEEDCLQICESVSDEECIVGDDGEEKNIRKRARNSSSGGSSSFLDQHEHLNEEPTGSSPKRKRRNYELEKDPEVLARRQRQIDFGKNTIGYERYIKTVPKRERTKDHPRTPPMRLKYSRRAFDGLVKLWRLKLHKWDPPDVEGKKLEFDDADGSIVGDDSSNTED